jgi:hypothetical protein
MPDSMIPWLIGLSVFLAGLFVGAPVWQLRRGAKLGGRRRRAAMAAAPADVAARRSPRPL